MHPLHASFLDELEKVAEGRRRSSKKRRAAGTSAGAVTGAMMGIPAGLLASLAWMATKGKVRRDIKPPKGLFKQLKYLRKGGLAKDVKKVGDEAKRKALIGGLAGAGGGAVIGGLAGHEVSKHAAALKSRLTPSSSNVRGYSYDPKSQDLVITYKNGGTYRYSGVPPAVAKAMGRNKSTGRTVHKRVKGGGFKYEKVGSKKKQKSYKCKFCKEPATKGVIWAEGRAIVPCCDKHLAKGKASITSHDEIDTIRDLTKSAQHESSGSPNSHGSLASRHGEENFIQERGRSFLRERVREGMGKTKKADIVKEAMNPALQSFIASRQPNKKSRTYKYYAKKRREERKAAEAKRMRKQAQGVGSRTPGFEGAGGSVVPDHAGESFVEELPALPEPKTETPISKRVAMNLAEKAEKLAEAGSGGGFAGWAQTDRRGPHSLSFVDPEASIIDRMKQTRRAIAKKAGVCKKTFTWGGVTMKFEYLKGDVRSGVNGATGKKWSRKMRDCYGYMPGTYGKGADGEAIDVYFNPEPLDGPVYKIKQKKKTGEYDEDKFMVGYGSELAARQAFKRNMPDWAFGSMTRMSMKAFRNLVGQGGKKVRVPSDGNAERERVRKALG
jgi:hypothetical protein